MSNTYYMFLFFNDQSSKTIDRLYLGIDFSILFFITMNFNQNYLSKCVILNDIYTY